jgi:hypothetical protein
MRSLREQWSPCEADVATPLAPGRYGADGLGDEHRPSLSERVYGALLHLYPAGFRARYRAEMVVLFGDQLRDAEAGRGTGGVAATWIRTLIDLARSAVGEHMRRDGTVAHSLATFQPTRSMRWLGLFGMLGAFLLLWAFISFNPFADPALNNIRLILFALAGAAISLAFYERQAQLAPTLALLTTAAVVIGGTWSAAVHRNVRPHRPPRQHLAVGSASGLVDRHAPHRGGLAGRDADDAYRDEAWPGDPRRLNRGVAR